MKTHLLLVLLLSQNPLMAAFERPDTTLPVVEHAPALTVFQNEKEATVLLRFELPTAGNVTLKLADTEEKMSLAFFPGWHEAGVYEKTVSVNAFSKGDYLAALTVNGQEALQEFKISR